jgi:hypothetical protein
MAIEYTLYENTLTTDPDDYYAKVTSTHLIDSDALVKQIQEQGSTVTPADTVAVLKNVFQMLGSALAKGERINLGFAIFSVSINGVFNGVDDGFDPSRHSVEVKVQATSELRTLVRNQAQIVKVRPAVLAPHILDYRDLGTGRRNSLLTPGNIGTIIGNMLRIDPGASDEGLYLINAVSSVEKKITMLQKNTASELVFLNPQTIQPGEYFFEVRNRFQSKDLRKGRFDKAITVT